MSLAGIHGLSREVLVTVVGCNISSDTDLVTRQHPWYVCIQYGSKVIIVESTDDGMNPTFQDKIVFQLIEGVRELNVVVGKNIAFAEDDIVGTGKVPLHVALLQGYEDFSCPLQKGNNSRAGELKLRLQLQNANANTPAAPTYAPSSSWSSLPGYQQQYGPYVAGTTPYLQTAAPGSPYISAYPPFPYPPPFTVLPAVSYYPPRPYTPPPSPSPPPRPPPTNNSFAYYLSPALQGLVAATSLGELLMNLSQYFGGGFN